MLRWMIDTEIQPLDLCNTAGYPQQWIGFYMAELGYGIGFKRI